MKTLILSQKDVRNLLTMDLAVPAVESAFRAHGLGRAQMPPKVYLSLESVGGDFRAMPSFLDGAAGVKWVNSHPHNPSRHNLPTVMGVYILSDPETALPLAVMDATWLTAARTGAAAAVASKFLARKDAKTLGILGCGVQARPLLAAHRVVYGDSLRVLAFDRNEEAARKFAEEVGAEVTTVEQVSGCDIICTSTPGLGIALHHKNVREGAHINAMGADAPGKQEIEGSILNQARVVIDDWHQATHSGEVNVPIHNGEFAESAIYGTLGEIVSGKKHGREGNEISVFDSTGLAIQDVAVARIVHEAARSRGVGVEVDIVG
ncbi:MAG: ornithine cyclodeaminase family protein [Polyangiaceae bacterium]